jgi:hypothetical protein
MPRALELDRTEAVPNTMPRSREAAALVALAILLVVVFILSLALGAPVVVTVLLRSRRGALAG